MSSLKTALIAIWLPVAAMSGALAGATEETAAEGKHLGDQRCRHPDTELDEIVVTGLKASLEKSLDVKRNATVVLDSINSEELGRFPTPTWPTRWNISLASPLTAPPAARDKR